MTHQFCNCSHNFKISLTGSVKTLSFYFTHLSRSHLWTDLHQNWKSELYHGHNDLHPFYFAPVGEQRLLRSVCLSVCVCVCLCICLSRSISLGTAGPILTKFFVQISCDCGLALWRVAIRYVLLVLWMTSRLAVMDQVG